ncbi:MAG: tetratricopeptide repeat protein [candidate division Zixibacteria bacterium]|nr:tetratricopeptide repeat protein [candidate division Zixibacteria bacterium]
MAADKQHRRKTAPDSPVSLRTPEDPGDPRGLASRRDRFWLGAIVAGAFLIRLIVLWQLCRHYPGFFDPAVDSKWHYLWAKAIAGGDWLGTGVFYRAPLYPYLLGIWIKLFGDGLWAIKITQAAIGALSAGLVCLVGMRVFGRRVGFTAGWVWAIYGTMIYYETELLLEVIVVPLVLWAIWLAVCEYGHLPFRPWRWLAVGFVLGLAAIARPNVLLTVPAFWMWSVRHDRATATGRIRRWHGPLLATLGLLIPIAPVTLRNAVIGHDAVLISYQGGVNLYLGNNPTADGLTMTMPELELDESVGWNEFVPKTDSAAGVLAGHPLKPSEISSFWTNRAIQYFLRSPGEAVARLLKKTYYLFNGYEVGDQTDIYAYARYSSLLNVLVHHALVYFPFGVIVPFGLLGLLYAWTISARARPLTVLVLLYAVTVIGFLVTARHRLPILPLLVLTEAAVCWNLASRWRSGERGPIIVIAVAGILLGCGLNLPVIERIMTNPAFTDYQLALVYDHQGDYQSAVDLYEKALRATPTHLASRRNLAFDLVRTKQFDSAVAMSFSYLRARQTDAEVMNNLGLAYLGQGDTTKAEGAFRIAVRTNPALAQPNFNLAQVAEARGQTGTAVLHYRDAIGADSTFAPAYSGLAIIYAAAKNYQEAADLLRAAARHAPDNPNVWTNLGAVLTQAGYGLDAVSAFRHALCLEPRSTAIHYDLAVAYTRLDSTEAAKNQCRQALSIDPTNESAQRLLTKIDSVLATPRTPR